MSDKSLVELYCELLESHRDGNAINPMPAITVTPGGMKMFALAVPPEQAWDVMNKEIANLQTSELIFGVDRFTKPGQGVATKSLVTVYYWAREHTEPNGWRVGIVPYDEQGCRPIQWNHPFWSKIQRDEITFVVEKMLAATERKLAKLGLPAEASNKLLTKVNELGRVATEADLHGIFNEVLREYRTIN